MALHALSAGGEVQPHVTRRGRAGSPHPGATRSPCCRAAAAGSASAAYAARRSSQARYVASSGRIRACGSRSASSSASSARLPASRSTSAASQSSHVGPRRDAGDDPERRPGVLGRDRQRPRDRPVGLVEQHQLRAVHAGDVERLRRAGDHDRALVDGEVRRERRARQRQRRVDLVGDHPHAVAPGQVGEARPARRGSRPGRAGCAGCRAGRCGHRRRTPARPRPGRGSPPERPGRAAPAPARDRSPRPRRGTAGSTAVGTTTGPGGQSASSASRMPPITDPVGTIASAGTSQAQCRAANPANAVAQPAVADRRVADRTRADAADQRLLDRLGRAGSPSRRPRRGSRPARQHPT